MSASNGQAGRKLRSRSMPYRLLCGTSLPALVLLALPTAAQADDVTVYWDGNGSTAGLNSGNGDWNTSTPNWSDINTGAAGTGGSYTVWQNIPANPNNVVFHTDSGTVNLTAPIVVQDITFQDVHDWTINSSAASNTLTFAGTTPTITANANTTINSVIAGSAGLTIDGIHTLTLNGANTFTGGVYVTAANLSVNGDAALGAAGNVVELSGGAQLHASGALSSTRVIDLVGGTGEAVIRGAGVGSARITGTGDIALTTINGNMSLTNDLNDFTGQFRFHTHSGRSIAFSSIATRE